MPKVQTASDVIAMDLLLTQVEKNAGLKVGHIGIEAQIETAQGLINVEEICAASPCLESIVFGPADFAASIGMPVTTIDETIHHAPSNPFSYVFAKILMAGRASGLHVIDGPFLKVRDLEALRFAASISASYGFDGKWALTPDQALVLNQVYSPSQELFDKSYDILDAYQVATERDHTGALMFGDEMIDELRPRSPTPSSLAGVGREWNARPRNITNLVGAITCGGCGGGIEDRHALNGRGTVRAFAT